MKDDIERLQGNWDIVHLEMEGREVPTSGARITVKGTQFSTVGMGAPYEGTMTVDAAKKPKTFDLKFTSGPEKGNTAYGIYELKDDRWKICLTTQGSERPKRFIAAPGTGHALEILERGGDALRPGKAGSKHEIAGECAPDSDQGGKKTKAGASDPEPVGPATEIEGEWSMVSGTLNGEPLDASHAKWGKRRTTGDQTTVFMGPQIMAKARFTLDPKGRPKTIDYAVLHGPDRGKTQLGIYERKGRALTICMAAPGKPRPKKFASKPGDGRTLTAWTLIDG